MSSGDVFQVDLVNPGAVFHVVGHPGKGDDEVDFQLRIFLQLREEMGFTLKHSAGSIVPPSGIGFLNPLLNLEEPSTPRDAIGL